MVYAVVKNFQKALQQRGGWKGLFDHMYTNGDYPFKFGTLIGVDPAGNRYYENRHDYPFGQHRWIEPADIQNFDSSSIPPEWHGWMVSQNDTPPSLEQDYFDSAKKNIIPMEHSDAPVDHAVGYKNEFFNFHHLHNQTSVRSRGYGIGNPVVGLPPFGVKDGYYTQPGSPYNEASMKKLEFVGDLDEGKPENAAHRRYKSEKWADRLRSPVEREAHENRNLKEQEAILEEAMQTAEQARLRKLKSRGRGTIVA